LRPGPKRGAIQITNTRLLPALLLLTISGTGAAQRVYKSIDADGNVSYSASPPAEVAPERVEPVRIDPAPPEAEQQAAQQRLQSAMSGSGSGARSGAGAGKGDAEPATASASETEAQHRGEIEAQFIERNRSDRRVSRGTGVGSGPDSGRAARQLPANRTSR
jgi:hypothetical protein